MPSFNKDSLSTFYVPGSPGVLGVHQKQVIKTFAHEAYTHYSQWLFHLQHKKKINLSNSIVRKITPPPASFEI